MKAKGRMERSEDGITWTKITQTEAIDRLALTYKNPSQAIKALKDGVELRTPYAVYRYVQEGS